MKTKVIYKERDANGVQTGIKEIIYPNSTWSTESGTLNVYKVKVTIAGAIRRPVASFPHGDWIHAERVSREHNPES